MLSKLGKQYVQKFVGASVASRHAATAPAAEKKSKKVEDSASFCMNLFRGKAVNEQVFPFPLELSEDRKEIMSMMLGPVEKFLTEVNDVTKNDETLDVPKDVLQQFAELGAFGALVPEEYEGAGLNNSQMARLAEIVGAHDLGLGVIMGAHQSIGYKGILLFGTEEQKKKYLPDLATGRKFASFCLTEPTSGSDANSIRSRAVKSEDGKHFILNGSKIWISNGGFADVFTVFAQTPIKQADGSTKDKVSAFIVERGFGGVTNGAQEKKMGIKGSNTVEVYFDNVKIPVENLIGEEGEGFKVAMHILNNGRFGIPAAMTGCMKHCIQKTVDHVTTRVQFGKKIMEFGNVQEKLTEMVAKLYATESVVYMLASNMDRGIADYQLEAAIGKIVASENAWWVCDEAIQLHGGMGFMKETGLERVLRDLRIFRIFEGANDILRLFVALTGSQHAGKHLQQSASGVGGILGLALQKVTGPSTGGDYSSVDPELKSAVQLVDKNIGEFGQVVQGLLIKHKKGIIDRQYELVRVADSAIDIYSSVAAISRCTRSINLKSESAKFEIDVTNYLVDQAMARVSKALKEASADNTKTVGLISSISRAVYANNGLPIQHPSEL